MEIHIPYLIKKLHILKFKYVYRSMKRILIFLIALALSLIGLGIGISLAIKSFGRISIVYFLSLLKLLIKFFRF